MDKEHIKFDNYTWDSVPRILYKESSAAETTFYSVERQNIVNARNDVDFEVRYFECGKNGFTTLEKHQHTHIVMIARGRGKVIIGEKLYDANPCDCFIISEWKPHQLINVTDEPFGFFCIVNSQRDKYQLLSGKELDKLKKAKDIEENMCVPKVYGTIQD